MTTKSKFSEFKSGIKPSLDEFKFMFKRVKKSPLSVLGISIVTFYLAIAVLAPVLAPPNQPDPFMIPRAGGSYLPTPKPPSPEAPFGTAENQYNIYYGVIWGTITAFRIGIMVVVGALVIGLAIGTISAYYGGVIDELMMRFTDIMFAFPGLILAMAFVIALPSKLELNLGVTALNLNITRLDKVLIALVVVGWSGYARLIRGEMLRVKTEDYVEAAKAVGCSDLRVIVRHMLPNAIYPIVIAASLDIGSIVLTAAALSFLGIGAEPGYADWGQLISMSQNYIYGTPQTPFMYWYTFLIPGVFIFVFCLGWNLLGDAFRDILDPMLRRR